MDKSSLSTNTSKDRKREYIDVIHTCLRRYLKVSECIMLYRSTRVFKPRISVVEYMFSLSGNWLLKGKTRLNMLFTPTLPDKADFTAMLRILSNAKNAEQC